MDGRYKPHEPVGHVPDVHGPPEQAPDFCAGAPALKEEKAFFSDFEPHEGQSFGRSARRWAKKSNRAPHVLHWNS